MRNAAVRYPSYFYLVGPMLFRIAFGIAAALPPSLAVPTFAIAQSLGPATLSIEVVGGTPHMPITEDPNKISSNLYGPRNTDSTGKPCLNVFAGSEKQIINPAIFNHLLLLDNHCSKAIKIKACYYRTDSCQETTAPPYKRQRYVFGIFTTPDFRFSFREYSNQ
jgi:hypothetical protein